MSTLESHLAAVFMAALSAIDPSAPGVGYAAELSIASSVAISRSSMPNGWSRELAVATMAVMAYRESRLNMNAIGAAKCNVAGDCKAYGAWQIEHHPEMMGNALKQAAYEWDLIKRSAKACPAHELAYVTSGDCVHAKVADDRMREALAALLVAESH